MAASKSVSEPIEAAYAASIVPWRLGRRRSPSQAALNTFVMMSADLVAVVASLCLASIFRFDLSPTLWFDSHPWLVRGTGFPVSPVYLLFFAVSLLFINRRDGLYGPLQSQSALHEQRRTIQASLGAGLLLCGGLYVAHDVATSRGFIAYFIALTTIFLCVLRYSWRWSLYRKYERGVDARNVLVVGCSPMGNAVRKQIYRSSHLARVFKGFVETGSELAPAADIDPFVLGGLKQIVPLARQLFIDEIIIAERCPTPVVIELIETGRQLDIEVLVLPGCYDELTSDAPVEYLGVLPLVALHRRHGKLLGRLLKRMCDLTLSLTLLIVLAPMLLIIALVIKLDSAGPIVYVSRRIGKKGCVFPCFKFRTMVANADELKASLTALNERDGILFKIRKDPRLTRLGGFLRKFSLDELPQLFNVLQGDMSLVGPRPPLAAEVGQYELEHLRRLEVLPGITGLWQVHARQDPSFSRYFALDLAYVENWSLWLDLKILIKTAHVVVRGTGC